MTHSTFWNDDGCVVKIYNEISYEDVEKINSELCSNSNFDNIKYFIRDLTEVKSAKISKDELEIAAYINYAASLYKKKLKGAFIINNKQIEDNVKFYITIAENIGLSWEQRVFSNLDDAMFWIMQ